MENLDKLNRHLNHIQGIVEHIKKKHLKQLCLVVIPEIITTPDGKRWIYDERHEWIEVTNPKKGKFVKLREG